MRGPDLALRGDFISGDREAGANGGVAQLGVEPCFVWNKKRGTGARAQEAARAPARPEPLRRRSVLAGNGRAREYGGARGVETTLLSGQAIQGGVAGERAKRSARRFEGASKDLNAGTRQARGAQCSLVEALPIASAPPRLVEQGARGEDQPGKNGASAVEWGGPFHAGVAGLEEGLEVPRPKRKRLAGNERRGEARDGPLAMPSLGQRKKIWLVKEREEKREGSRRAARVAL